MFPKSAHSGFTKENWYFLLPLLEFLNTVLWLPKKKVVGDSRSSSSSSTSSILVRCAHHSVLILLPCKAVYHENNESCPANHYRLKSWLVLRGCLSSFFSPPPIRETAQIHPPWPKFPQQLILTCSIPEREHQLCRQHAMTFWAVEVYIRWNG